MDKNKEFSDWYLQKIKYYVDNGYCKLLSPEQAAEENERTYYMPHFAASNVNKPGKLRWVCDAAAKSNSVSLNDHLLKGPDQLNSLPGILLRFRRKGIAFGGDVKEMFHQIKIIEEDKDSQRFLFRGLYRNREPDVYRMEVLIFGAASSPCSAQYVMKKTAENYNHMCPETVQAIKRNIFMDDYLDCEDSEDAATQRIQEVIKIQSAGGLEMMKWITNSEAVLNTIPEERRAPTSSVDVTNNSNEICAQRVLGIHWAGKEDQLVFKVNLPKVSPDIIDGSKRPTKREALRLAMSLFDPLGMIAHFTIRIKILLQEIWKEGTGWDEKLTDNCWNKWKQWICELVKVENVRIPRCYSPRLFAAEELNMHVFTDSSSEAYSSVIYLQIVYETGIVVAFVMGKARVAPVKPQNIPRLELQGALMGTRIAITVTEELDLDLTSTTFWTDSQIVLCWIRSDTWKFKMFVSSRIGEILESTDASQWKWVPTLENPADVGTRDKHFSELTPSSRWLVGPEFLHQGPEKYPVELKTAIYPEDLEIKKEIACMITISPPVIDYLKYSSYLRLVRITGWILKWKRRFEKIQIGEIPINYLSAAEIENAKLALVMRSQREAFGSELAALQKGLTIEKNSNVYQLQPFLDKNGIMRMRSRLNGYKPIILDGSHAITKLIIMEHHCQMLHGSKETVIHSIRKTFWIPRLRSCVNVVSRSCMRCKVEDAKVHQPIMGNLPECRQMANFRPFHYCGVDYYGPLTVAVNRKHEKRYGVLFVCMNTGAVLLDFVKHLNTDSCIRAINRLTARRGGKPAVMLSDNGTNFVGANKELKKSLENVKNEKIAASVANIGIKWKFIPPRSPHFGGKWERQIKTVKSALSKTLTYYQKRVPTEEIMRTLLLEVEFLVNCRPLTHVSVDGNDEEALTPNHFLFGAEAVVNAWGQFTDDDVILRQEWKKLNRMADYFWERWTSEYLPTLAERRKWNTPARPIKYGDLVFIVEIGAPRGTWIRGKVEKLYPGKDGIVRVVDVKTASGIFRRSVSKCAVIDIGVDQGPSP